MVGENENFSKISLSPDQIRQILSSSEGQALIRLLQRDGGKGVQAAAKAIREGNTEAAQQALSPLLREANRENLAEQLRQKLE